MSISTAALTLYAIDGVATSITAIILVFLFRRTNKQSEKEMQGVDKRIQEFVQFVQRYELHGKGQETDYESEDD